MLEPSSYRRKLHGDKAARYDARAQKRACGALAQLGRVNDMPSSLDSTSSSAVDDCKLFTYLLKMLVPAKQGRCAGVCVAVCGLQGSHTNFLMDNTTSQPHRHPADTARWDGRSTHPAATENFPTPARSLATLAFCMRFENPGICR